MDKYEAGQIATDRALLRFITCGSVDNGKSTLIGRLLFESRAIYDDEIHAARNAGSDNKTTNSILEFAHLLDGLEAERSQGITIDVAYRFFSSERRRFIVADTPGHEEYIRNMATAASTADLAIIVVDAQKGRTTQTDRHAYIASMLGVRHALIAINKIDAVDYSEAVFDHIRLGYINFLNSCNFSSVRYIPVSARFGDNITTKSPRTPWYQGLSLLGALDATSSGENQRPQSLRLPVQIVLRQDNFRGYAGNLASGHLKAGELVVVARTGRSSLVQQIFVLDEPASEVETGEPVTIVLEDDLDVSRGDILVAPQDRPHVANRLKARVIWFDRNPLLPGRTYLLKTENNCLNAVATSIDFEVDMSTRQQSVVKSLSANTVGVCNFTLQNVIAFDAYNDNRVTGNFIILDRATKVTLGAGMIEHPLREASNIHPQPTDLTKQARSATKSQSPAVVWLTGLSGAGKSTIANMVESKLHACGKHTYVLDSDNLRHGLNQDLSFSSEDRTENIRRLAEVAKLMVDAGLIVVVASISPLHAQRQFARDLMMPGEFIEVFVDTPIEECVQRDPKGLYQKALAGKIENFTGISSAYERPQNPEIHVRTPQQSADEIALLIVEALTVGHAGTR